MAEISLNELISGVGDDVIIEILIRLPDRRSAIQCSSVCKRWLSLISGPQFIRTFTHHHNQKRQRSDPKSVPYSVLFVDQSDRGIQCFYHHNFRELLSSIDKTLPPLNYGYARPNRLIFYDDGENICAADKDLLLIRQPGWRFHVRNPLTGQSLSLPSPPITNPSSRRWLAALVCEREIRGGEKVPSTRFRVILIEHVRFDWVQCEWKASIFCSETGRWSSRGAPITSPPRMLYYLGDHVVANEGILYWLLCKEIAVFDLFKGVDDPALHRHIGLPSGFDSERDRDNVGLGFVRGKLRLSIMFSGGTGGVSLKVWELNCSRDGWVLVHDDTVMINKINPTINVLLIGFEPGNADAVLLYWKEDIVRYDFVARRHEIVGQFPEIRNRDMECGLSLTLQHPPWPTLIPTLPSIN